ncbi:hypothetical protein JYU34_018710 [Plutella xylostella]|uniref:ATP synthase subunit d, mitochondrial n=2 Tax=Plutella xylostella TaxID=51655 RepID=A0ABQ7PY95_PLUXY|nr:ATP synthase subunit d, mitochondrial [Plutella xylostella]KAG7297956.1 hypothetical protein JYU34_018710 [Plutella xylostella]
MAKFAKSSINWVEMEKKVALNQKAQYMAFKAKSDSYLRKVQSFPETPPPIDWELYKKTVPVEGMVDMFRQCYQQLKVPYPQDTQTAQIEEQWKQVKEEIQKYKTERNVEIAAAKKELARIAALPKFDDMTMEMFFELYPDMAQDFVACPTFWPHTPEEQPNFDLARYDKKTPKEDKTPPPMAKPEEPPKGLRGKPGMVVF